MTAAALTPAGTALLAQIGRRGFSFFDDGIVEHSGIWEECLTSEAGGDVAANAKGVDLLARKLERDCYLESHENDDEDSPWVTLTALGAETANRLANTETKENTMTTIADIRPGTEFVYNGETLTMVKVNATSFRASVADGSVKSFKAKSSRKVELPESEDLIGDVPGTVETTTTVKWEGKVRESKTVVRILDAGKGADPRWSMQCVDHGRTADRKTSTEAWTDAAHPKSWCPTCKTA
jgi:hypothetical protein